MGKDEYTNTVTTTTGNQISTTTTGIPETAYYCLCMADSNGNTSTCNGVIIYTDKPQRCPTFSFFLSFSGLEQKHKQCPDLEAMLDTHMREHSSKQHIQRIYTPEKKKQEMMMMMMKADDDYDERRGEVGTEAAQECLDNAKCDEKELRRARLYKGTEEGEGGGSFRRGREGLGAYYLTTYLLIYLPTYAVKRLHFLYHPQATAHRNIWSFFN